MLTVTDEAGGVVRRITGPVSAGFHRVAWDLRYPAANPTSLAKPAELSPWDRAPAGPLAAPGTYQVSLARRVEGKVTPLAGPVKFAVEALGTSALPPADRSANLAFQRKTARLQRAVLGAVESAREAQQRLDHLKKALLDTPAADPRLSDEARAIESRLKDLQVALSGDELLAEKNEPVPPAVQDRVQPGRGRDVVLDLGAHEDARAVLRHRRGPVRPGAREVARADRGGPEAARGAGGDGGRAVDAGPRADLEARVAERQGGRSPAGTGPRASHDALTPPATWSVISLGRVWSRAAHEPCRDETGEPMTEEKQSAESVPTAAAAEVEVKPSPFQEIVQPFVDVWHAPRALWGVNLGYMLEGLAYFGVLGYLAIYFSQTVFARRAEPRHLRPQHGGGAHRRHHHRHALPRLRARQVGRAPGAHLVVRAPASRGAC